MQVPFGNARKGTSCVQFVRGVGGAWRPCPRCPTPLGSIRSRVLKRLFQQELKPARQERGAGSHQGAESAGETANAAPSAHSKAADMSAHERAADVQMQEGRPPARVLMQCCKCT
jgi:hypothetical protein